MTVLNITIDSRFKAVKRALTLHRQEFDQKVRRLMDDLQDLAERWIRREAPHKTGRLKSATRHEGTGDHRHIFVSKRVAPYMEYVIDGRGIITPKTKQALRFKIDGKWIFAKSAKATKPNPYVDRAFRNMLPDVDRKVENFHKWLVSL